MKKIIILLVTMLLLCSCTKKDTKPAVETDATKYIQEIKEYKPKEKNINNKKDNADFDAFLETTFVDAMNSDYMTMHFSVVDYRNFNIDKPPVDMGELSYSFDEENFNFFTEQLQQLREFDYDSLSYRQQYDYEALEYSILETLASYCFYRYNFLFSTGSCIAENVISNFVDFTFYDDESIQDYLACLADIDRYFDDALKYTEDQYKDGLPLLDSWIDYSQDACNDAVNKVEDNELITSFEKRLATLDFVDEQKKTEYIETNKNIVINEVIPSLKKISSELEKYRGKAKNDDYRLSNMNKDYAELTYILNASTNYKIDDLFQNVVDALSLLEAEYLSCLYSQDSYAKMQIAYAGDGNLLLTGRECLDYLKDNLDAYYPDLGNVEYSVEALDPDTAPATTIAYYWPSPIDNHNQNIIRTNPNNMAEGFRTYNTLSHEGFPGHLYQHVFYQKTNPHNFRTTIGFIGYTEGWAVNASYYAMQASGIDDHFAASALFTEANFYFLLYSIIDMGVNYYGWKESDIIKFFDEESRLFQFDNTSARDIINDMIEMPGVYIPYGAGYANFSQLENKAKDAIGGKFDYVKYHEAILKNGPLPFNILNLAVDEYITENR